VKRSDLRALARTKLDDAVAPYLWADTFINGLLDEAVQEANLRARFLVDSTTTEVCEIVVDQTAVDAGTTTFALDPSIIIVRRAEFAPDDPTVQPLAMERRSFDELDRRYPRWRSLTGPVPYVVIQDLDAHALTLHPSPTKTGTVKLTVWRHPLATEMLTDDDAEPIIPAQHHRRLVEWVCSQAYTMRDPDTEDEQASAKHLALFDGEYGQRPTLQQLRRLAVDHEEEVQAHYY